MGVVGRGPGDQTDDWITTLPIQATSFNLKVNNISSGTGIKTNPLSKNAGSFKDNKHGQE